MLAKFAGIALVQFVLGLCLVFGLIKYCATPWLFGISIAGSYITSLAILKLEGLKIYYYELIKPKH